METETPAPPSDSSPEKGSIDSGLGADAKPDIADVKQEETDSVDIPDKTPVNGVSKKDEIVDTKEALTEEDEEELLNESELACKDDSMQQLCSDPNFAQIVSFFNLFGSIIGLKPLPFIKLERMFLTVEDDGTICNELIELQVALLRKIRYNAARADKIVMFLQSFCGYTPHLDSEYLQMERYGYPNLSTASKLSILNSLCTAQFDKNLKLKEAVQVSCKASDVRLVPIGVDKNGLEYYYQQDSELNVRVYTQEKDDHAGLTWCLIVKTIEEFDGLIDTLIQEDLGYVKKETLIGSKDTKALAVTDENGKMILSTKKGTFVDVFLDEQATKTRRETREKEKLARKDKKMAKTVRVVVESEEEKEAKEEKVEDQVEREITPEFSDRRILPRRTARASAVECLHKLTTPSRKPYEKKKKEENGSKEGSKDPSESGASDDDAAASDEQEDEEDFESAEEDDDDEFKPKTPRVKTGKRRGRNGTGKPRKKKVEVEEEDDESDDEEQEIKERKKATEETCCKKCKKSDRWDVLLLCDICDDAWHTDCLHPPLWFVPDDVWFCPKCVHGLLIERLELVRTERNEAFVKKNAVDEKRKAEAERMKRELEYIGVSITNILPALQGGLSSSSSESEEEDEEDTRKRKSKKKAIKRIAPRAYQDRRPPVTITEGRSRRSIAKPVDYNFEDYDRAIKDACEDVSKRDPNADRPQGGAGRGKDMANIIEADQKRRASVDETMEKDDEEDVEGGTSERKIGQPAKKGKTKRKSKKLNALDSDQSESEVSEYNASDDAAEEAEASVASESDYIPSDEERRRRTTRGRNTRTRSDDEFVVSGSDESWNGDNKKTKRSRGGKREKGGRGAGRWGRRQETSEEESESEYSDDSTKKKKKKKGGRGYSESEEDSEVERNKSGRPLRRAAAQAIKKKVVVFDEEDEEEEEKVEAEEMEQETTDPTPKPPGSRKRKIESDEEEFKPEGEEEEEEEEDDEEDEVPDEEENEEENTPEEEEERMDDEESDSSSTGPPSAKRRAPPPKAGLNKNVEPKKDKSTGESEEKKEKLLPEKKPIINGKETLENAEPKASDSDSSKMCSGLLPESKPIIANIPVAAMNTVASAAKIPESKPDMRSVPSSHPPTSKPISYSIASTAMANPYAPSPIHHHPPGVPPPHAPMRNFPPREMLPPGQYPPGMYHRPPGVPPGPEYMDPYAPRGHPMAQPLIPGHFPYHPAPPPTSIHTSMESNIPISNPYQSASSVPTSSSDDGSLGNVLASAMNENY